jgi:hypothetical protein
MDLQGKKPTKELMAAVIRAHHAGQVVIGIDTCPTGTGKTTSGAQFLDNLENFLATLDAATELKIVIIASQHRYLGNYWKPGTHEKAIRFLGAEEYARRVRAINNEILLASERMPEMIKDGLMPPDCPLRSNDAWHKEMSSLAERKKISMTQLRDVCRTHLQEKLAYVAPDRLLTPCNTACPLAGGTFFGVPSAKDQDPARYNVPQPTGVPTPRIALITSAKFRYRVAAFEVKDGQIRVRTADFQEISNAVILFEEACDVFESLLSTNDETASSTELLSDGAQTFEFLKKHRDQAPWVDTSYQLAASLYLDRTAQKAAKVVIGDTWLPINIYQASAKGKSDFLLPVSRDRVAVVMADAPRYILKPEGGAPGHPAYYRLLLTDGLSVSAGRGNYGPSAIRPTQPKRDASMPVHAPAPKADATVEAFTMPLGSIVSALFKRSIRSLVRYFHWSWNPEKMSISFRDFVSQRLQETLQFHSNVQRELRELVLSHIDCGDPVKNLRSAEEIFSEDYYYKHGIAYCEIHKPNAEAVEDDPLRLTLNISNAPPELMAYELLKRGNSLLFSSASIKLRSPYTNLNLDWLIRKHLGELTQVALKKDRIVIDMDDARWPELVRLKRWVIDDLLVVREWEQRPVRPIIFKIDREKESGDSEYLNAYEALVPEIRRLNKKGIPAIGIVLVNSYDHARELLRKFCYQHDELRIGELCGINTDTSRTGLSVLETWVRGGIQQKNAAGRSSPLQDSMLFDEIERVVARQMGMLLSRDDPMNGIVVSVRKKIGKGANLRNDLSGLKLGTAGRRYLGPHARLDPANPYVDFNFLAWAEHPRNMVNIVNYRRIAVMGISIGGREMQEKLTQRLRANDFFSIQRMMKWSRYGAAGVLDATLQELGRPVRCRTRLPVHRFVLLSNTHARLFMLGMGSSVSAEFLVTPDIKSLHTACTDYWLDSSVPCNGEGEGAAGWVSDIYRRTRKPSLSELKAVRDIRGFLGDPNTHVMGQTEFEGRLARALKDDYGTTQACRLVREEALVRLRASFIVVSYDLFCRAKVGGSVANTVILNHIDTGAVSVLSYRRKFPGKKAGNETMVLLKPREMFELAYPACDELAIRRVLDALVQSAVTHYQVKAALDTQDFLGAIIDGTHEAGDFLVIIAGMRLLIDAKTTALFSAYSPERRDLDSVRQEVLSKSRRLEQAEGFLPDAFIFANSGWECQDMWYYDELPDCPVPVYHMDACTTMNEAYMRVEFEKTLQGIVYHLQNRQSGSQQQRA